jgi:hypothetical protein
MKLSSCYFFGIKTRELPEELGGWLQHTHRISHRCDCCLAHFTLLLQLYCMIIIIIELHIIKSCSVQRNTLLHITPCSGVILEKLMCFSASQEIPHILWNPRFITTFTTAHHCPYNGPDQSNPYSPSHFLKIHFNTLRTGAFKLFKCTFPGFKQYKSTFILCFFKNNSLTIFA